MKQELGDKFKNLLREARKERGLEQPGRNGADADAHAGEVAGDGERHANDGALGGRVGCLANLAVIRSNARCVHNHAAEALDGGELGHAIHRQADHVECSDGVHLRGELG